MKKILMIAVLSASVIGCKGKKESNSEVSSTQVEQTNSTDSNNNQSAESQGGSDGVCILDKLSIRETPGKKGKWITSMSIGEKITFTGEEVTDSITKKSYSKVRLVDGKEGWTRSSFVVVGGKIGAMLEEASVYKRPDLLTKTDKKYSPMDIIAVVKTQGDDWVQIKGKRRDGEYVEEAWIKPSNISEDPTDVATAKFALQSLSKGSMTDQIKALNELVGNSDFSKSKFIPILQKKIASLEEKNNASKQVIEKAEEQ